MTITFSVTEKKLQYNFSWILSYHNYKKTQSLEYSRLKLYNLFLYILMVHNNRIT